MKDNQSEMCRFPTMELTYMIRIHNNIIELLILATIVLYIIVVDLIVSQILTISKIHPGDITR